MGELVMVAFNTNTLTAFVLDTLKENFICQPNLVMCAITVRHVYVIEITCLRWSSLVNVIMSQLSRHVKKLLYVYHLFIYSLFREGWAFNWGVYRESTTRVTFTQHPSSDFHFAPPAASTQSTQRHGRIIVPTSSSSKLQPSSLWYQMVWSSGGNRVHLPTLLNLTWSNLPTQI